MRYVKHGLSGKCGVYLITCIINNKSYVGASVDIASRVNQHFGKTCLNKYSKIHPFYSDILKYGRDNFKVECLELCPPSEKLEKEIKWFRKLKPEYNLMEPCESPLSTEIVQRKSREGCKRPEARKNILEAHRTPEYRKKCREKQRYKMIPCRAISDSGEKTEFESLSDAARWLDRKTSNPCVVTKIKESMKRNGSAYGYRWEVIKNEDN